MRFNCDDRYVVRLHAQQLETLVEVGGVRWAGSHSERQRLGAMVALRGFIGSDGQEWQVWDTRPAKPSPRAGSSDERSGAAHSERVTDFGRFSKKREDGWLTFTAANERARLSPIPDDWESADETALRAYLAAADRIVEKHEDDH